MAHKASVSVEWAAVTYITPMETPKGSSSTNARAAVPIGMRKGRASSGRRVRNCTAAANSRAAAAAEKKLSTHMMTARRRVANEACGGGGA